MKLPARIAIFVLLWSLVAAAMASTEITYQGQLKNAGTPHTGMPDMTFRLFDSLTQGQQVGPTLTRQEVPVEDGLFRVQLDFGSVYSQPRWLEIEVEGTTLSPRQRLDVTPRSIRALTVGGLPHGADCSDNEVCESGICDGGICAEPRCDDGLQNGPETGIDCGSGECTPCPAGQGCGFAGDCLSEVCFGGICQQPACDDGERNGLESDVDCGGPECTACEPGDDCLASSDCQSGVCNAGTCLTPSCSDAVLNGNETDVDCGGPNCTPCSAGEFCEFNSDCASGNCDSRICQ